MDVEVYEDKAGEWRWRVVAQNNKIIADSGEGYGDKEDCLDAVALLWPVNPAPVFVTEDPESTDEVAEAPSE